MNAAENADAILLIYHHPVLRNAPTILEHVTSFERYSRYPVIAVNTEYGFDPRLRSLRFPAIVLHYSLFGCGHYFLSPPWYDYLDAHRDAYKTAFFQDEFHGCPARFKFLNDWNVDCVYSLYDPCHWKDLYLKFTAVRKVRHSLAGYVDEAAIRLRDQLLPDEERPIDIGYRARKLSPYMGRGAQEKWWVARDFMAQARDSGLKMDISWEEGDRIYGAAWYRFVANCKGTLGAESGVSISDPDGTFIEQYEALVAAEPNLTFEQLSDRLLSKYEDNIPLRTISPRSFEAAALNTCQILLEGSYNDVLVPWKHYLPLKKDFSNFQEVFTAFRDPATRRQIVEAAFNDLVASERYSYRTFVAGFDAGLVEDLGQDFLKGGKNAADLQAEIRARQHRRRQRRFAQLAAVHLAMRMMRVAGVVTRRFPFAWRQRVRKLIGLPVRERP